MVYLAAALIVVWLAVVLFVAYMFTRQRKLEQELQMVEEQVIEQQKRSTNRRA